jgi:hypothetical protein
LLLLLLLLLLPPPPPSPLLLPWRSVSTAARLKERVASAK